jgi:GntR family transcriptional regulator, transcriptional repressor for pyruvate dehydrogenase complex
MGHLREELMDARLFFEPQIAREVAKSASPEDLRQLEDVIRRQEDRTTDGQATAEEDAEFHRLLALATHNTVVIRVMEVMDNLLKDEHARWFKSAERSKSSLEGNRRILEAIQRRDQEAAQKAMEQHIQDVSRGF